MEAVEQERTGVESLPLRVGIALGAGSAAAMAEIGALERLVEAGIPIHCAAGTSAGAIVGAAYGAGRLTALREDLCALSRRQVLRLFDVAWPREGLLHGLRGLEFVRPHLGDRIEALALPYAAVATDLLRSEEVVVTRGPVLDAVRASIAIPGIFTPWRIGGRVLVDGGLLNPVPVSAAEALGAEFVIVLNVLPLHTTGERVARPLELVADREGEDATPADPGAAERLGMVDVVWRASRILVAQVAGSRLRDQPPGYLLQIPVPEVGMFDLHRTPELVEAGRQAADAALPDLRRALARAVPLGRRLRQVGSRLLAS